MKVSELMKKHPLKPEFAGVTTNDDWVLAVKTSSDQASEKDYVVIQSGVTSHAASINSESADSQYVRTGKNRTWVFCGSSSDQSAGSDSLYDALDMDIDWDGSGVAAEEDNCDEQAEGRPFYVSGTYAPGGDLGRVQLDPNEAGISKAKIASFDALNQPLLPGDRVRLRVLTEKETREVRRSAKHRMVECTGILAWTTEPIKMRIRRVNVWGAEAFSLEAASGTLFRSFRLDAESLARFRSVLKKIPPNMSARALLYPRGRTRVSVEMHMDQAPILPCAISEQENLVRSSHSVPRDFPEAVLAEARRLPEELSDKAQFVKINVDDNPDLAREYGIMSIPCVMVFKGGELAGKNLGFVPKAAMKEFIEKNI